MPDSLLEILDDLNDHIERGLAKVPEPVANALLRGDAPLSTLEMLRLLAKAEGAAISLVAPASAPGPDEGDRGDHAAAT